MDKVHLVRIVDDSIYLKTACGTDNQNNRVTTRNPKDVTCQRCLRCMTKNEIQRYLGGYNG